MALGTLGAIALGAGVLGGGAITASAGASAARSAANASQQATESSNRLAADIFGQNQRTLAPFVQQGGLATGYINQLLGIQAPQQPAQPAGGMAFNPGNDFMADFGGSPEEARMMMGGGGAMGVPGAFAGTAQPMNAMTGPGAGQGQSAFDAFRNSTGYNFRLGEGLRAIEGSQAARGLSRSGDTLRRLSGFGQDMASAEFGNYLNTLLGQQSLGSNAASAQAGVANNYSSQVQQNNAANAANVGNAALARANITSGFVNNVIGLGGLLAVGGGR